MDILDLCKKTYGNETYLYALYHVDEQKTNDLVSRVQTAYDHHETFVNYLSFDPAKMGTWGGDEEEATAAAAELQSQLQDIVVAGWLGGYGRADIMSLRDLLLKCPDGEFAKLQIIGGITLDVSDILRRWSELHPGEDAVYLPDPD